jgi:hypothetical protein
MASASYTRLLIEYEGRVGKLLNVSLSRQNDVYVHIYRDVNEAFRPPSFKVQPGVETTFSWEDFAPTDFQHNKITFHPSGYVHSTDQTGRRLKDGIRGLPFSEIDDHYGILVVVPRHPSELPATTQSKKAKDVVLEVPSGIRPFILFLALYRAAHPPVLPPPKPPLEAYLLVTEPYLEYGVIVSAHFSHLHGPYGALQWPPFTFWLARVEP